VAPRQDEAFAFRSQLPDVRFQWNVSQSLSGLTREFLLEVSADHSMANPALTTTVDGTSILVNTLAAGTWFWRVTPVFPKSTDAPSLPSPVQSFTITQTRAITPPEVQSPEDKAVVAIAGGATDIRFAWKNEAEAASYNLRIADNPAMNSPLVNEQAAANYFVYPIADGPLQERTYYWTVSQTDKTGEQSPPSRARQLTLTGAAAVIPLFPPDEHRVFEDALSRLKFSWRLSGSGGETRFQLSSSPDFSTFTANEVVRGYEFRISTLPPGTYYWRIRLTDGASQTVFSPTRTLVVTRPLVPRITLEYPAEGQHISAVLARQSPPALRWSAGDQQSQNVRLVLAASPDPFQGRPLMDVNNPGRSLPLIPLEPGTYYWAISAANTKGQDVSTEKPASFIVDPPVLFPAPANRRPANNYRLGVEYLQKNREIVFTWNRVAGANRYILTIYSTDSGQRTQVLQTEPLSALTYTLTNLSQLTGKNFVWSVEAVLSAGARIDQRGSPGENSFVVDIPVPKVVIDKPGKLYGK
jgi:hypothetical protein